MMKKWIVITSYRLMHSVRILVDLNGGCVFPWPVAECAWRSRLQIFRLLKNYSMDSSSHSILTSQDARSLLGIYNHRIVGFSEWTQHISQSISEWTQQRSLLEIGDAAFEAFLQTNVTGPPLSWDPVTVVLPAVLHGADDSAIGDLQKQIFARLSIDGEALYQLTPNIELFYMAKLTFDDARLPDESGTTLRRLRVNFWHQRMLGEVSPTLQQKIYEDLSLLEETFLVQNLTVDGVDVAQFLLERAAIHTHHGFDARARHDLERAAKVRSFQFALTGHLGKRTKYQEIDLSQLVVLAKSAGTTNAAANTQSAHSQVSAESSTIDHPIPKALQLNDDTLLETIAFATSEEKVRMQKEDDLPLELQSLDPGNQPLLEPLDAIILLATASSIDSASPADALTREETLPFAERVLSGCSSNWQVYTQALLVRSRIESHRSRTVERGVLQLQAVVDQVIAETTSTEPPDGEPRGPTSATFLPQPKESESAPIAERIKFIHQLAPPLRWQLEAELAGRWISLGGLRTALEIYQRLQMWAEVALCLAANDQETEAKRVIRKQLYDRGETISAQMSQHDQDQTQMQDIDEYIVEKAPLPADAPRLFCILGDIEKSSAAYERAWEISNYRYARAQRSLGKYYSATGDLPRADEAYSKSLRVNPQNHPAWFALGCIRLQIEDWARAVDAFGRAVQIENEDAESWSNLAVALLNLPAIVSTSQQAEDGIAADNDGQPLDDSQKHIKEAYIALKRAAALKRDSFRIWQNLLSVSVRLVPHPYTDIVIAQTRLIDLLGKVEGEKCVDIGIVEALLSHLVTINPTPSRGQAVQQTIDERPHEDTPTRRTGFEKMLIDMIQKKVTPLITSSRRLWLLTAKLSLHLNHPSAALASYEKAWRVTLNDLGWETGGTMETTKRSWRDVWESTIDLVDAYESLGERRREAGMGAGELVAKDWKFKARSAVRSVVARAKEGWEGDEGYDLLTERLRELKNA